MNAKKRRSPPFEEVIALSHQPPLKKPIVSPFTLAYDAEQARRPAALPAQATRNASTVDKLATVDKLPTPGRTATNIDGRSIDPSSCQPATLVQHGHTRGEHAAYMALWTRGGPPDRKDDFRDVSVGYDKLAADLRGSKRNTQRLIEALVRKLAIEIIGVENSGAKQGKTYRVFGMAEILRRRKEAGYTYVFRNRSAVELVKLATVDKLTTVGTLTTVEKLATVDSLSTVTVDKLTTVTVDSLSTPSLLDNSLLGKTSSRESSSSDSSTLVTALIRHQIYIDAAAANRIITRCRNTDSTATIEEIVTFAELKVTQLAKRRNIENWPGMLITAVPVYFDPPATELQRYREGKTQEREKTGTLADEILQDPEATEADREWARAKLSSLESSLPTG